MRSMAWQGRLAKVAVHTLVAVALCAAGCGGGGDETQDGSSGVPDGGEGHEVSPITPVTTEIVIGAMLPRTGSNANDDWIAAANLALEHMNAAMSQVGSSAPLHFRMSESDTASDQAKARAAMATFAAAGAKVVVSEASAAATGANMWNYTPGSAKLPVIAFTATSGDLNNPNKTDADPIKQAALRDAENWFFRTCMLSSLSSPVRAKAAFSKGPAVNGDVNGDGIVKIAWVTQNLATSLSSMNGDITAFKAVNPTVVTEQVIFDMASTDDPSTFDYTSIILQLSDAANSTPDAGAASDGIPDLIYNKTLTNIAIPFIKAYRASGRTIPMFQDGAFRRNVMLVALGTSADGQEGVSYISYERNPSGQTFLAAMQAKQAQGLPPAGYDAQVYDAMISAMLAVAHAFYGPASLVTEPAVGVDGGATALDGGSVAIDAAAPQLESGATATRVRDGFYAVNNPAGVKVGTGPAELQKAVTLLLAGTPIDYEGAGGNTNFDSKGDVKSRVVWWQIEGGAFVEKKVYDCVADSSCPESTF